MAQYDSIEKANSLNFYYYSVFSCERSVQQIHHAHSGNPFTINNKIMRKKLPAIGKNKSVGTDSISGGILKLGAEVKIPYFT
jgi:hypothetical protein